MRAACQAASDACSASQPSSRARTERHSARISASSRAAFLRYNGYFSRALVDTTQ
jgi:hypothetical protein